MRAEQWLRPYVRANMRRFAIIIGLGVLTVLCASALMFTSGYLISKSALRPENILMVYVPVVLVRTFGISRAVVHYIERLVGHDTILRILSQMRVRLYRLLEPQALFIRSRYKTGDLLSALADDIEYLQNVYMRTIFPSMVALVMYAVVIVALGWFDLQFAILMALYLAVLVFILPAISLLLMNKKLRQMKQERNGLYQKLTDAVLGINDWVVSGRAPQFVQSYEDDESKVAHIERSLSNWAKWRSFIGQCVIGTIVVSMVYWAGQRYTDRQIDVTLIAAFVLVVLPLMDAFLPVSEAVEKIPQYRDSFARLAALSGQTLRTTEPNSSSTAINEAHLTLEHVYYRYDATANSSDVWALANVSLDIPQGKKMALIGRSGSGKSTLLKLMQGAIEPCAGSVRINGAPAHTYEDQMQGYISVLNQRPHLFDTTVANNIRLGRPTATEEDIRRVAKQVKLDELIESLPEGYNTPMHEAGQRFSGGERQRVALARVLLQNAPIVILDEPTVGLDPRTERDLLTTIFQTLHGRSLIWITHHLVGVEQMDEVIFMENGKIGMKGSHQQLMKNEPRYSKLYQLDKPIRR
ncbi:thiol reductant ABC exporter subunit CydC [Paenibacillus sp. 481]|uniref:thiol reductant ABC exporter subunit CydC n=1 Tax=Paenibacillus sp. 481 TaxID=2835869 RepID=UPI001E51A7C4|nr:thiol reductant ABC exporter subunit CydC [Paenibacillus sp. 481]UHA75496.1 thiol reductant ABC exporter subunit CydC [Paenibacillus sp. 481]